MPCVIKLQSFQEKEEAEVNKMRSIARADTSPTINQEEITAQMIVTTIKGFILLKLHRYIIKLFCSGNLKVGPRRTIIQMTVTMIKEEVKTKRMTKNPLKAEVISIRDPVRIVMRMML